MYVSFTLIERTQIISLLFFILKKLKYCQIVIFKLRIENYLALATYMLYKNTLCTIKLLLFKIHDIRLQLLVKYFTVSNKIFLKGLLLGDPHNTLN